MPELVTHLVDVHVFRRRAAVEFLMLRRAPTVRLGGSWQIVHGKIRAGETAIAASLRELHEETALRPLAFWQLECLNTFFIAGSDQLFLCPVFVAEVSADAQVILNHEHDAFRWADPEATCAALMWPGERAALREIQEVVLASGIAEPHLRIDLSKH